MAFVDDLRIIGRVDREITEPVDRVIRSAAAKYRGQPDAEAALIAKVTKGGKGAWGSMAMPPQSAKPEDVDAMVKFILSRQ